MADNLKVKAKKALDDARVAAHAVLEDVSVAAHNTLVDTEADVQKVSDEVKISVHKAVADAKIAAHQAEAKVNKDYFIGEMRRASVPGHSMGPVRIKRNLVTREPRYDSRHGSARIVSHPP